MVYRSSKAEPSSDEEDEGRSPSPEPKPVNAFTNDGSFLEMFKKMQEKKEEKTELKEDDKPSSSRLKRRLFNKKMGGRTLPTGKVKKLKTDNESEEPPAKDAWSVYLAEVRRYKETTCEEDGKTRPLVK